MYSNESPPARVFDRRGADNLMKEHLMKRSRKAYVLGILLALGLATCTHAGQTDAETFYYAIEINDVLCGYSEIKTSPLEEDGKTLILLEQRTFAMLSALGSRFDSEVLLTYHIDPVTGRFSYHDSVVNQGTMHLDSEIQVAGDQARFSSSLSREDALIELGPDVVLENTLYFPHLVRDFADGELNERSYEIFEVREQAVQRSTYTRAGAETLELAGKRYDTIVLERLNHSTGLKLRLWLDPSGGTMVKVNAAGTRTSYLADSNVVKKIEVANLDENLIAKVGVAIPDIHGISRMKVRARIEPTGLWVTPESLNVTGQRFTGSVEENLVDGIFEIQLARYDGSSAPPFPADYGGDETLREYLEPSDMVESDDPALAAKAFQITAGSADSWEAARRLARWVAENIDYAIPGGGTARKTFEIRAGECGAHSFLFAAFCRAVGIPARVVWGCMYVPTHGGGFGQHGWNEVYMGEAGWIPLDTTAMEIDFADSGHIRLGEVQSMTIGLNPIEMELLEYEMRDGGAVITQDAQAKHERVLGEYTQGENGRTVTVKLQDGSVAVDIPGKIVLALLEPDEQQRWYCTISNKLYCTFVENDAGSVEELQIHEMVRMRKTSSPAEIPQGVPEEFAPYLGAYLMTPMQAEFTVIFDDGGLAVEDPLAKATIHLLPPDKDGNWLDEFDKNTIRFARGEDGQVEALVIDAVSRFRR